MVSITRKEFFVSLLILLQLVFSVGTLQAIEELDLDKTKKFIFQYTNEERKKAGLASLKWNDPLSELAAYHSRNMVEHKFFSHVDHKGMDPAARWESMFPHIFGGVGENIAYAKRLQLLSGPGSSNEEKVAHSFVTTWMNSPGHRKNILRPMFNSVGIALSRSADGEMIFATQNFGALVAMMVTKDREFKKGETTELEFEYLGEENQKNSLTVMIEFPDKNARYVPPGANYYFKGYGFYPVQFSGNTFTIDYTPQQGVGRYRIQPVFNEQYFDNAFLSVNVSP